MTTSATLDRTFAALADPTRRAILLRLAESERTVNELAAPFRISLPAVSRHLKVLEKAALIVRIRDGQRRRCRLNPAALDAASDWLAFHQRFWSESVDRLAAELRRSKKPKKPKEDKHGPVRKARRRRN
jgi:DNA-binding transcriptional ArsR family regulator